MKNFTILIFVLLFGLFSLVCAERNRGNMKEHLGLNAEQEEQMKDLKVFCRTEESRCFERLSQLRSNLFEEARKDNPDEKKLGEIAEEIGKQHSLLALCLARQIQEVKKILTQEQFEKFIELRQNSRRNPAQNKPK